MSLSTWFRIVPSDGDGYPSGPVWGHRSKFSLWPRQKGTDHSRARIWFRLSLYTWCFLPGPIEKELSKIIQIIKKKTQILSHYCGMPRSTGSDSHKQDSVDMVSACTECTPLYSVHRQPWVNTALLHDTPCHGLHEPTHAHQTHIKAAAQVMTKTHFCVQLACLTKLSLLGEEASTLWVTEWCPHPQGDGIGGWAIGRGSGLGIVELVSHKKRSRTRPLFRACEDAAKGRESGSGSSPELHHTAPQYHMSSLIMWEIGVCCQSPQSRAFRSGSPKRQDRCAQGMNSAHPPSTCHHHHKPVGITVPGMLTVCWVPPHLGELLADPQPSWWYGRGGVTFANHLIMQKKTVEPDWSPGTWWPSHDYFMAETRIQPTVLMARQNDFNYTAAREYRTCSPAFPWQAMI